MEVVKLGVLVSVAHKICGCILIGSEKAGFGFDGFGFRVSTASPLVLEDVGPFKAVVDQNPSCPNGQHYGT